MTNNIPIYRAKKIDSDEYAVGFYIGDDKRQCITILDPEYNNAPTYITIDPSTLAIHFPSMNDSDDKKIFASLDSENGIGGDILKIGNYVYIAINNFKTGMFLKCIIEESLRAGDDLINNVLTSAEVKIKGIKKEKTMEGYLSL